MACPTCEQLNHEAEKTKLERCKFFAKREAKKQGLDKFAILKTRNSNPGYMWRPVDHPDCERIGVVEYCVVD